MGWASLAALGGIVLVVAVTFLTALRVGRHNVIDTAWGLGFLVALLAADAVAVGSAHHGGTDRRLLITVLDRDLGAAAGDPHGPSRPRQG